MTTSAWLRKSKNQWKAYTAWVPRGVMMTCHSKRSFPTEAQSRVESSLKHTVRLLMAGDDGNGWDCGMLSLEKASNKYKFRTFFQPQFWHRFYWITMKFISAAKQLIIWWKTITWSQILNWNSQEISGKRSSCHFLLKLNRECEMPDMCVYQLLFPWQRDTGIRKITISILINSEYSEFNDMK